MYTFCFVLAGSAEEALRAAGDAVSRLGACLPSLGSAPRIQSVALPEARAAFVTLKPEVDVSPSRIQHAVNAEVAVLVFGESAGVRDLAGAVRHEFSARGVNGVAKLPGNFSAVIVERLARRVWLCGTLLGHRSVFYYSRRDLFMASPHDLTLLATGRLPFEVDPISLASMVACDWSLSGRSLLANVTRCHPLRTICWENGAADSRPLATLELGERVDPNDRIGMARQLECVVDGLMSTTKTRVQGRENVRCALTAGMDSRAVFAAIHGAAPGQNICAVTSGGESSLDVVIARRLAAMLNVKHERSEPVPPTTDDFVGTTRLQAFFCSGDTNAKRAMTRLPRIDPEGEPSAGGNGGEIYRGFFYQYFGVTGTAPRGVERIAARLEDWRFRRLAKLPFCDPAFRLGVHERLSEALRMAESVSADPYDIVDLLYLFERYGRWGAVQASQPWIRSWTPFESATAIREAFRLPAPIGRRCSVHSLLIRRYLPARAYWQPINGGQLLALDGPGRVRYALRQALNGSSMLRQQLRRQLQKRARRGDDMKAAFWNESLGQLTESLIDQEGSISRVLFGRSGVRDIMDSQRRNQDQLAVVGILMTAEVWRQLAETLSSASRA
jgi:hypothetical protein